MALRWLMETHTLIADGFSLSLELNISEQDIKYPSNTIMNVSVKSESYSAISSMDIDIKKFALFSIGLKGMYDGLSGTAEIEETYGYHKFLKFISCKNGYISVKGYLCDDTKDNELFFNNAFDQTFLKDFADKLYTGYSKYCT